MKFEKKCVFIYICVYISVYIWRTEKISFTNGEEACVVGGDICDDQIIIVKES